MSLEKEYVLGTDRDELARLGLQHRIWSSQTFALWERAGFKLGQTILDLGCGPGYASIDLAQLVTQSGRVIAVDASTRFLAHLRQVCVSMGVSHVETIEADVQEMELPADSIDGAYCRWVMCFLSAPERAVAAVARALRPGGVLAIQDYFNYHTTTLAPRGRAFDRVVQATSASWRANGGDPDVAARLPAMLRANGLEVREITPHLRVARPGSPLWQWPTTFFHIYTPKLVAMGHLTDDDRLEYEREWAERTADPGTFFCTPPVFDIVAVKN